MVSHGGQEIGQGINTVVAMVVAHELGIALDNITITGNTTEFIPISGVTGASMTTPSNAKAAKFACDVLNERLRPIRESVFFLITHFVLFDFFKKKEVKK